MWGLTISFLLNENSESIQCVERAPLKRVMYNTIKNGGDLKTIKHIYNTRYLESRKSSKIGDSIYYVENYPLSGILNDLKVDYYQGTKEKDSVYFKALSNIISENDKHNPFDNLDENQRYIFVSIQEKSDSLFAKISPDLIKIADELNNRNQLVNKYLIKSETSFYISIGALILTFIFSLFQIYQNYKTKKSIDTIRNFSNREKQE